MASEKLLRLLTVAIVTLLAVLLLNSIVELTAVTMASGFNALLMLVLVAILVRFYSIVKQKR